MGLYEAPVHALPAQVGPFDAQVISIHLPDVGISCANAQASSPSEGGRVYRRIRRRFFPLRSEVNDANIATSALLLQALANCVIDTFRQTLAWKRLFNAFRPGTRVSIGSCLINRRPHPALLIAQPSSALCPAPTSANRAFPASRCLQCSLITAAKGRHGHRGA